MLQWLMQPQKNTWQPEPVDLEKVRRSCTHIPHEQQQNICVVYDKGQYIEVVIENDIVVGERGRFIIAPDYFWTDEETEEFDRQVSSENMAFSEFHMRRIYEKYADTYPEWHLKYYKGKPLRILDHIHQCQMQDSPKEILYKAGLDEIAVHISQIEEYNLIGSTPSSLLDGLSIRTLKAINLPEGIMLIKNRESRSLMVELQRRATWLFAKKMNSAQCRHLGKLLQEEQDVDEIVKIFKSQCERLADLWTTSQADNYSTFLEQKEIVEGYLGKRVKEKDFRDFYEYQEYIRQVYIYLIRDSEEWNEAIFKANQKKNAQLELEDETYVIRFPRTIEEFFAEAQSQGNCLMEYLEDHVYNISDILLLRKKERPEDSFVTLEVYDGQIIQAYGKYNKVPDMEVQNWISRYAVRVGIEVDEECYTEY